ncbi:MAG TPA: hypothetical protein VEY70_06405 [Metabacillus sp.]|nr:hypothetical protein [Metabacillus sp.]
MDGSETKLNLNPLVPDENGNNILDGKERQEYNFPQNQFNITGKMIGYGDLPMRFMVRETPYPIVKEVSSPLKFDLYSLDDEAVFEIQVPLHTKFNLDLMLFKFNEGKVQFELVENQKTDEKKGIIHASVVGGGTFILASKKEWDSKFINKNKEKELKFTGKAKVVGIPGLVIEDKEVNENGKFKIMKVSNLKIKSLENNQEYEVLGNQDQEVLYSISSLQQQDGANFVSLASATPQTGKQPVILVHGLYGSASTWGARTLWENTGPTAYASTTIDKTQTFTKTITYYQGDTLTYDNIDATWITSVPNQLDIAYYLMNSKGYTANVDLFVFQYNNNLYAEAYGAGSQLKFYIDNLLTYLKSKGSPHSTVNLIAHSKGGLVSRYAIENFSAGQKVQRLITLGTPHYASDYYSGTSDLARSSYPWVVGSTDRTLKRSHPYTRYFAFGGFKASATALNSSGLRGLFTTAYVVPYNSSSINYDSYYDYVRDKFAQKNVFLSGDIEDGPVNIDSALGSDRDPDQTAYTKLPTLSIEKRYLIFHETYGDHSKMREYQSVKDWIAYHLAN